MTNRPRLELLSRIPRHAVCAEIGVWKGEFTEVILAETAPEKMHLIDPWLFQAEFGERMYGGSVAKNQADMDAIYAGVQKKFSSLSNVTFNRGKSDDVLASLPDDYFDWVYIDGNHFYDFVTSDLEHSLRTVKPGGLITGDDYLWGSTDNFPVKTAVADFVRKHGLENSLLVMQSQYLIQV